MNKNITAGIPVYHYTNDLREQQQKELIKNNNIPMSRKKRRELERKLKTKKGQAYLNDLLD